MSKNGNTMPPGTDPNKARKIKKELRRLETLFEGIEENRRDFIQRQLEQLAWLNISIIELQGKVDRFGTLVQYDNGGGQSGVSPNPDLKTLIAYQKQATTIVRTLNSIIPIKETGYPSNSKLMQFMLDNE